MIHYVYTTARGLCRTVHAEHAHDAWRLAEKKHKPQLLADLTGATWVESTRGGAIRDLGDVTPEHARTLYFQACLAEIPNAEWMLRFIAREPIPPPSAGKVHRSCPAKSRVVASTPRRRVEALLRLLVARGLYSDGKRDLTDLGRAFAAWTQGGAALDERGERERAAQTAKKAPARIPCTSADLAAAMDAAGRHWIHTRLRQRVAAYGFAAGIHHAGIWRDRYMARAVSLRAHYGRTWTAKGERQ